MKKRESSLTIQVSFLMGLLIVVMIVVTACGGGNGFTPDPNTSPYPTNYPTTGPTPLSYGNLTGKCFANNGTTPISGAFVVFTSHIFGTGSIDASINTNEGNYFTGTTDPNGIYTLNNLYAGQGRVQFWTNETAHNNDPNNPLGAKEVVIIANTTTTVDIVDGTIDPTPIPQPTATPIPGSTPTPTNPPTTPIPTVTPGGGNVAPQTPSNLLPANSSINQPTTITLSAVYQDANGDVGSMRFYLNGSAIGTANVVAPGTRAELVVNGLLNNTNYSWYCIANDGQVDSNQSATFTFTTIALTPTPTNTPTVTPSPTPTTPPANPAIDPNSLRGGAIGDETTITGTNFGATQGTVVFFDGITPVNAVITGWTDTSITYRVPDNTNFLNNEDLVPITITTAGSKTVSANDFIVIAPPNQIYDTSADPPSGSRFAPGDIAQDAANHVFITATDMEKIARFDLGTSLSNLIFSQQFASGAYDLDYCFSNNKIYSHFGTAALQTNTDFTGTTIFGNTGQLNQAKSIAINRLNSQVLIPDITNIEKFGLTGTYLGSFVWGYTTPSCISTDSIGNIYIGQYNTNKIVKTDSAGANITEWSCPAPEDSYIFEIGGKIFLLTVNTIVSGPNAGHSMLFIYETNGTNHILVAEYVFNSGLAVGGIFVYQNPTNPNDINNGNIFFTCGGGEILGSVF